MDNRPKHLLSLVLLDAPLVVLTALATAAWVNNVSIAIQWRPDHHQGTAYRGIVSVFDWTAVDLSTVTTLIPMIGLALILRGVRQARRPHRGRAPGHFPFFTTYMSFTCSLGLIGTVQGLIMLGYYDQSTIQLSDLTVCLRTALYSTLTALVWVFLVAHPARRILQCFYNRRSEAGTGTPASVPNCMTALGETAAITADRLNKTSEAASTLSLALNNVLGVANTLAAHLADFQKRTGVDLHQELSSALQGLRNVVADLRQESAHNRTLTNQHSAILHQLDARFAAVFGALQAECKAHEDAEATFREYVSDRAAASARRTSRLHQALALAAYALKGGNNHEHH